MLGFELGLFYLFLADLLVGRGSFGTATSFGSCRRWRPRLFVCVDSGDGVVRPRAVRPVRPFCFTTGVSQYYYCANTAICRRLFLFKKEIISFNLLVQYRIFICTTSLSIE